MKRTFTILMAFLLICCSKKQTRINFLKSMKNPCTNLSLKKDELKIIDVQINPRDYPISFT
jgi:hypothetical protein